MTRGSWVAKMNVTPVSLIQPLHDVHHLFAVLGIQVGGGLVGQDEGRVGSQRPGHGDALLLAAAQLVGAVVGAILSGRPP